MLHYNGDNDGFNDNDNDDDDDDNEGFNVNDDNVARLAVTRPRAAVTGGREKHVNLGDRVSIACELRDSGDEQQPEFVFW